MNKPYLTPAELQVLQLTADGLTDQQIGERMMRVIKIGPVTMGIRKRQQLPQEYVELRAAIDDFGQAVRNQPEVQWLVQWFERVAWRWWRDD